MTDLIREEPPVNPKTRVSVEYADDLEKIKAEPGEWFRLAEFKDHASPYRIRNSLQNQTKGFEFTATQCRLYARYVGEVQS